MKIDTSVYTFGSLPSLGLRAASARPLALGLATLAASAMGCLQSYPQGSDAPSVENFAGAGVAAGNDQVDDAGDTLVAFEGNAWMVPDIGFPNYDGTNDPYQSTLALRHDEVSTAIAPEAVTPDCLTTYTGWQLPAFGTCKAGGAPNAAGCNGWQPQATQLPSSLCGDGSGVGVAVAQGLKATLYTKTVGTKTGAVLLRGDNLATPPPISLYGTIFWDTSNNTSCFFDLEVAAGPGISYPVQVGGAGGLTTPNDTGADCPSCHVTNLAAPLNPLYLDKSGTKLLLSLFNSGKAEAAAGTPYTNNQTPGQTGANPALPAYSTILASKGLVAPLMQDKSCRGANCHNSWNIPSDTAPFNGGVLQPALTKPNGSMSNMRFLSVRDCTTFFGYYNAPVGNFCVKENANAAGLVKNNATN